MPKFVVDLHPIGLDFKDFTTAKDPRDAVHHSIVRYFGTNENVGLFVWKQKQRFGERGWAQRIEQMTDEVIEEIPEEQMPKPEPPKPTAENRQLELFESIREGFWLSPGGELVTFPYAGGTSGMWHGEVIEEGLLPLTTEQQTRLEALNFDWDDTADALMEWGWVRGITDKNDTYIEAVSEANVDTALSRLPFISKRLHVDVGGKNVASLILNEDEDLAQAWHGRSSSRAFVYAFEGYINKAHPATDIAHSWKLYHKMAFMDFDSLSELVGDKPATFSVKYDGELCAIYYDGGKVELVTIRGTIRTGMPPTKEAAQLLSGHKNAIFLGELYAVDEMGKPLSYMKSAAILKNPKGGNDHLLRLSVFDLYSLDGVEYESLSIEERMKEIDKIFGNGNTVHPALTVHGTMDKAEALWADLETKGWEGLVVHFGADLYKIKPIQSYDLVVMGINKSKFVEQISAVLCAFMDKEGRFRLSGAISGGFNDEERIRLMEWAERNKIMEDNERIWVDPFKEPLIVEVEAIETNEKNRPTFEFKDKKWVKVENMLSGSLRFPQFVRERDDKEPVPADVSVEQVVRTSMWISAATLIPGRLIKTVTGAIGQIVAISPRHGQLGPTDFDVVVQWSEPVWGKVEISEIHPTEISEVWA
jgi:ATP-dependent DNA ligase